MDNRFIITDNVFFWPFKVLLEQQERFYWRNLLMSYLIMIILIVIIRKKAREPRAVWSYLFPKSVYLSRSSLHDFLFFLLLFYLQALVWSGWDVNWTQFWITQTTLWLEHLPWINESQSEPSAPITVFWTLLLTLSLDLSLFLAHALQHKVPALWAFHKAHHSAKTMTPLTVYRQHPVDILLNVILSGIFVGITLAVMYAFSGPKATVFNIGGVTLIVILFYLFGFHLRHSHIWLGYGPLLSRILISPAQHQIHHSRSPRHRDRNFGFIFSIWDSLLGTLYVPMKKETLEFGLMNLKDPANGDSFLMLLLRPIPEAIKELGGGLSTLTLLAIFISLMVITENQSPPDRNPPSTQAICLLLEDLTTQEVRSALSSGWDTVILPTGGVEQNGPHMILGKHNYIVKWNAIAIAEELGKTLVAPVISLVPEGSVSPPEGHMQQAGTLSARESTFAAMLEDAASSLIAHGFKKIIFIGDSGGNQTIQALVARNLDQKFREDGIRVIAVTAYYTENGQAEYLRNLGFEVNEVIRHAGIRDTSELMFIHPDGVRTSSEAIATLSKKAEADLSALGKTLSALKVRAAAKNIREQIGKTP